MKTRNVIEKEMFAALRATNKKFANNVEFNRFDATGKNFNFTLKVKSSKGKGARRGFQGRRLINACWHVHGTFFEELFKIQPQAIVVSSGVGKITKDEGNWQDRNIGSIMQPMMFSDACDCDK